MGYLDYLKNERLAAVFGGYTSQWHLHYPDGRLFENNPLPPYSSPLLTRDWMVNSPVVLIPEMSTIAQFGATLNHWVAPDRKDSSRFIGNKRCFSIFGTTIKALICSNLHTLSLDTLSPDVLGPNALSPDNIIYHTLSPCTLSFTYVKKKSYGASPVFFMHGVI